MSAEDADRRAIEMTLGASRSADDRVAVGLCAACCHRQRVVSARGAVFWLCRRSAHDPAFVRYPRLPVLRCPGYEPKTAEP